MYGVPADLDLSFLSGAEPMIVSVGLYQISLQFHPLGIISIEGEWELRDAAGQVIDRDFWGPDREKPYQLHRLLGHRVVSAEIAAPESVALKFDHGFLLRVYDRSPQFESFSIQPGNIFV